MLYGYSLSIDLNNWIKKILPLVHTSGNDSGFIKASTQWGYNMVVLYYRRQDAPRIDVKHRYTAGI